MDNREIAELVFEEELKEISEPNIKRFVLKCFEELTPDYFWEAPASSSGSHHPKISNGRHGLVRHVKLVCWWAKKLEESLGGDTSFRDVIIAASLLHDLQKFGTTMKDGKPTLPNYASTHGAILALQMEDIYENLKVETEDSDAVYESKVDKCLKNIIDSVAWHMGKWSEKRLCNRYGEHLDSHIVHLADYCASKKVDSKTERLEDWEFPDVQ